MNFDKAQIKMFAKETVEKFGKTYWQNFMSTEMKIVAVEAKTMRVFSMQDDSMSFNSDDIDAVYWALCQELGIEK